MVKMLRKRTRVKLTPHPPPKKKMGVIMGKIGKNGILGKLAFQPKIQVDQEKSNRLFV